jgi:hypothetical protein
MTKSSIGQSPSATLKSSAIPSRASSCSWCAKGILDEKAVDALEKDVEAEIQEASDRAVEAALPEPGSYKKFVYSPDLDPTSSEFQTEAVHPTPSDKGAGGPRRPWPTSSTPA